MELVNIHVLLEDASNPIVFGYGDYTSQEYSALEVADNDELLINIKSHSYQQTDNYDRILEYIDSRKYDVAIVGHSCSLSDKTLLKTIFENQHCQKIKAFQFKEGDSAIEEHL
jgi:hypothetical protein